MFVFVFLWPPALPYTSLEWYTIHGTLLHTPDQMLAAADKQSAAGSLWLRCSGKFVKSR